MQRHNHRGDGPDRCNTLPNCREPIWIKHLSILPFCHFRLSSALVCRFCLHSLPFVKKIGSSHGMRNEMTRKELLAKEEKKASNGKELCHFPRRRSLYV